MQVIPHCVLQLGIKLISVKYSDVIVRFWHCHICVYDTTVFIAVMEMAL